MSLGLILTTAATNCPFASVHFSRKMPLTTEKIKKNSLLSAKKNDKLSIAKTLQCPKSPPTVCPAKLEDFSSLINPMQLNPGFTS